MYPFEVIRIDDGSGPMGESVFVVRDMRDGTDQSDHYVRWSAAKRKALKLYHDTVRDVARSRS